ncbi:MAG TPA: peptide chain release factor 2 [Syntrophus sp. (in: bacteria)]|nr:peptide chain release factor 2 [Syntrophus sp. (in: bacteria)]
MNLRRQELELASQKADFWNDPEEAREILKEKTALDETVERWHRQQRTLDELADLHALAQTEQDAAVLSEIDAELNRLDNDVRQDELKRMLGNEEDALNAIVSIHAGAGGTEAQDWAEMLLRMYLRWAEKRKFTHTVIDSLPGDEAGIKSVTFTLEGAYAYGYAKAENGIHRLVRISPFDAGARRHTSFASVFVYPEIDDQIVIDIDEKDLRIDTYRSTGAGGQHVNKTDSAVRITHLPTGIVVQCQNERSQHKNRSMAMKYLKSRLYELKIKERNEKQDAVNKNKKEIAWGSQIRSYVLHPYRMVKDHRTNLEVGNVNRVLDGDIDDFIEAYLLG